MTAIAYGQIDMHAHTTASDGTLSPAQLVTLAKEKGLSGVGITDHDTVAGHQEAILAGAALDVLIYAGVELSADEGDREVHMLGYFVHAEHPGLVSRLAALHRSREERMLALLARLQKAGVDVAMQDVLVEAGGDVLGRPHLGRAMVRKGAVKTVSEAFALYIGNTGSCFVPKDPFPVVEAVALIRDAGGIPVIAHPALIGDDSLLPRFVRYGVAGIEVVHPDHDEAARQRYRAFAVQHGLYATGGSDFHGKSAGHRGDLGSATVPLAAFPKPLMPSASSRPIHQLREEK